MKKRESINLALIFIWPIIATIISFTIKPNFFVGIILFLVVPSFYLSIQGKKYWKKAAIFAAGASIPIMVAIDYITYLTGIWIVPETILPFKIFDFVTLEVILWAFFTTYFVVVFYEYFLDKHATKMLWTKKTKYLFIAGVILFILFVFFYFFFPNLLKIPYWYLVFGIIFTLIPFLLQLFKYPKTTSKFFLPFIYFFFLHFIWEITALKLGWWDFPGEMFIGWVSIFGTNFPFEEVLFWFILLALSILSFYEYFDDDEK